MTTFGIVETFKGPAAGATVQVEHRSGSSASCGVRFKPGRTYTISVYPGQGGQGYATSQCSTWMFSPNVGLAQKLIAGMRRLKGRY